MVLKDDLKAALDLSVYLQDPLFFYLDGVKTFTNLVKIAFRRYIIHGDWVKT